MNSTNVKTDTSRSRKIGRGAGIEIHATLLAPDSAPLRAGGLEKFFIPLIYCLCVQDSPDNPCPCHGPVVWLKRDDILASQVGVRRGAGGERVDRFIVAPGATVIVDSATEMTIERIVETFGHGPSVTSVCPERVLDPSKDLANFAQGVAANLRESGIRASISVDNGTLEWTNLEGDQLTLRTKVSETNAPTPTVEFEGSVAGKTFCWKISISHDDAVAFKKFEKMGIALFRKEIQQFVAGLGGDPLADQDDDNAFCMALGAGTGLVNPVGGFLLGATCLWFASNGLD